MFALTVALLCFLHGIPGSSAQDLPPRMDNIQYLAKGYDVMKGNPLPTAGALVDPGFKTDIFELTYHQNSVSADGEYLQPDHTSITGGEGSCDVSTSTKIIEGRQEYSESLSHHVGLGFGGWGAKFSMSYDYQDVYERTETYKDKYTVTETTCLTYVATAFGGADSMQLSERFISNVNVLPLDYENNVDSYDMFVTQFGTHYITNLQMGALLSIQARFSESSWYEMNSQVHNVKQSASYSFMNQFSIEQDYGYGNEKEEMETFDSYSEEQKQITLGKLPPADGNMYTWHAAIVQDPAPINSELSPITNLLDEGYYGNQFREHGTNMQELKQRQANLRRHYVEYCDSNPSGISCSDYGVDPTHECPMGYYEVDSDLEGEDEEIIDDAVEDLNACAVECDERFGCVAFEYNWIDQTCATYKSKKLGVRENRKDRHSRMKSCIMSISYAGHEAIDRKEYDPKDGLQFVSHYEFPHDGLLKYWEFYSRMSGKEVTLQVCNYRSEDRYECGKSTTVHSTKKGKNTVEANIEVKKGQVIGWYAHDDQPIVYSDDYCHSFVRRRTGRMREGQIKEIKKQYTRCYSIRAVVQDYDDRAKAIDRYTRIRSYYEYPKLSSNCRNLGCSTMEREDGAEQCAKLCEDHESCTLFMYTPETARGDAYRCCRRACKGGMSDMKLSPGRKTWDIYVPTNMVKGKLYLALGDRQDGECLKAWDGTDQISAASKKDDKYEIIENCYSYCKEKAKNGYLACEYHDGDECQIFDKSVSGASGDRKHQCWIMGETQYYTSQDPDERCVTHDIRTATQCEEANYWIGGKWKGSGTWTNMPRGCIVNTKGTKWVRWNEHCADKSHVERGVVCKSKIDRYYSLNPKWEYNCNIEGFPQGEEPKCEGCDDEPMHLRPNQCYHQCGRKGGYCDICNSRKGTKGACCRMNSDGSRSSQSGDYNECDAVPEEAFAFRNYHACVLVGSDGPEEQTGIPFSIGHKYPVYGLAAIGLIASVFTVRNAFISGKYETIEDAAEI